MKQQEISILDEMIEEHKKVLKNEGMCDYDIDNTIRSNILNEAKSRIQALGVEETLEDIIEDIGKRMCHAGLLYPNTGYWTLQDKWGWECKGETLIEVYKQFREELKRNGHYD